MSKEPKRYEIRHINDIFSVPEDRFDDFLVDLKSFYTLAKPMCDLVDTTAQTVGLNVSTMPESFTWIDDGKHDATIRFKNPS